jgi:glucose-6-phosphate 1-dehydrogenase
MRVKLPGEALRGEPVELIARHHSGVEMAPYERLLGDALRGDSSLFTRDAAVEAAWRVVDPVLDLPGDVPVYPKGSWGPPAARGILAGDDDWHDPVAEVAPPC